MKSWPKGVPRCNPRSPAAFEATWSAYIEAGNTLERVVGYQKRQPRKRRANLRDILVSCYGMNPRVFER